MCANIVIDKSPSRAHTVSKEEIIAFLGNFKPNSIYGFLRLDVLRNVCKKGNIEKHPEKLSKEKVIEILLKYNYKEVLDSINLDELRQVSKVVIEEVRYREYQKVLAEKEINLKQEESTIENRQGTSVVKVARSRK